MSTEYHVGDKVTQYGSRNIGIIKPRDEEIRPRPGPAAAGRRSLDVCLVIPLREEFEYASEVLQFGAPVNDGSHYLHPFLVPGTSIKGAAVVLFDMGLGPSAVAATRLLATYEIKVLALVGIAGALIPALNLGDVVVAESVDEYLHGSKARPATARHGVEFEVGGVSWRAAPEVVDYANNFRYLAKRSGFAEWREQARARRDPGLLTGSSIITADYPDYLVGAVATGDIVSASESFARWLRRGNRLRAAVEMEAGGIARAIYAERSARMLVVRGISDFADERKHSPGAAATSAAGASAWRRYAMHNAVDLLAALIANRYFPWPDSAGHRWP